MSVFFGTDGLRGIVGENLSASTAYRVGNSLGRVIKNGRVFIARDTRLSGCFLSSALALGLMASGIDVVDGGILPSGAVAYITQKEGFSCGVVITASHNPCEYNGIKIFSPKGCKIEEKMEEQIERGLLSSTLQESSNLGQRRENRQLQNDYISFLMQSCEKPLDGLKIVVDSAFGANYFIAPNVLRRLGAKIIKVSCDNLGEFINHESGALHPENAIRKVKETSADIGLCFDGDGDRLIAISEKGEVVDGDKILAILALYYKKMGKLTNGGVVGTSMTNMGIEKFLSKNDITFERADVGDRNVFALMQEKGLVLGGEQAGHIIIKDHLQTGDGLLSAIMLISALKDSGKKLSLLSSIELYPQTIKNIEVKNKEAVLSDKRLLQALESAKSELKGEGRVVVRASGTEPKIRVMVEGENQEKNQEIASSILSVIALIGLNGEA